MEEKVVSRGSRIRERSRDEDRYRRERDYRHRRDRSRERYHRNRSRDRHSREHEEWDRSPEHHRKYEHRSSRSLEYEHKRRRYDEETLEIDEERRKYEYERKQFEEERRRIRHERHLIEAQVKDRKRQDKWLQKSDDFLRKLGVPLETEDEPSYTQGRGSESPDPSLSRCGDDEAPSRTASSRSPTAYSSYGQEITFGRSDIAEDQGEHLQSRGADIDLRKNAIVANPEELRPGNFGLLKVAAMVDRLC